MRVAISGSHATGKSTLIAELSTLLPHYTIVEEPYYGLLENGYVFADDLPPEDYETSSSIRCGHSLPSGVRMPSLNAAPSTSCVISPRSRILRTIQSPTGSRARRRPCRMLIWWFLYPSSILTELMWARPRTAA